MLLVLFVLSAVTTFGQSMREVFSCMPQSVCIWLSSDDRLDLIDFKESAMRARVQNYFGSTVELTDLTDTYARLTTSAVGAIELRLLERKKDNIVCAVFTYKTPALESIVRFYTTDWEEIDASRLLSRPVAESFLVSAPEASQVWQRASFPSVSATLSADAPTLTFTIDAWGVNTELRDAISPYVRPLVYAWNGKRFSVSN